MGPFASDSALPYPVTPDGKASLLRRITQPSRRTAGTMAIIAFDADPLSLLEFLPRPLEMDGDGRVLVAAYDAWIFGDDLEREFVSEDRVNYTEVRVMVPCVLGNRRYYYIPFAWVNRDWLAYDGRLAGVPHKLAKVQMTRFHGSDPLYWGLHDGIYVNVTVETLGLVLRAQIRIEEPSPADELPLEGSDWEGLTQVGYRYLHDICDDSPAFNDLVAHTLAFRPGPVWTGEASLEFGDAENEEVGALQPRGLAGGWCFSASLGELAGPPEVIHQFDGHEAFSHVTGEAGGHQAVPREHAMPYPVTARGKATLASHFTDPSHRLAGNMIIVDFDADPDVVRRYVPEPLEVDGEGRVYLWTYDGWVFADRTGTEFVSESRANYAETFFMIPCTFEGELYHYMLYSWVTRDWLAYRGRRLGMPHKLADVEVTRFHPADAVYHGPGRGVRLCVAVEGSGLVLRTHVDLTSQADPSDLPFPMSNSYCPRFLGWRCYHDVVADRPGLNDLVRHWGDDLELGPVWSGPAELEFYDAENEEVLPFQPLRVRGGWFFTLAFRHTESKPEVIYRYGEGAMAAAFPDRQSPGS